MRTLTVDIEGRGLTTVDVDDDVTDEDLHAQLLKLAPKAPDTSTVIRQAAKVGGLQLGKQFAGAAQVVGDVLPDSIGQPISNWAARQGGEFENRIIDETPEHMTFGQQAGFSGVSSGAMMGPFALGGGAAAGLGFALPKVVSATTWAMGFLTGADRYATLQAEGFDTGTSALGGLASGLTEKVTEHLPMKAALKGGPFFKWFKDFIIKEGLGEQLATLQDDIQGKLTDRPDLTLGEYLQDAGITALATPIGGGMQAGITRGTQAITGALARRGDQSSPEADQKPQEGLPQAPGPILEQNIPLADSGPISTVSASQPPVLNAQTEGVPTPSSPLVPDLTVNKQFDADVFLDVRKPVEQGEVALFRVESVEKATDDLPDFVQYTTNPDEVIAKVEELNGRAVVKQIKATPAMIEAVPEEKRRGLLPGQAVLPKAYEEHLRQPLYGGNGELIAPAGREVIWRPGPMVETVESQLGDVQFSRIGELPDEEVDLDVPESTVDAPRGLPNTPAFQKLEGYLNSSGDIDEWVRVNESSPNAFWKRLQDLYSHTEQESRGPRSAQLTADTIQDAVNVFFEGMPAKGRGRIIAALYSRFGREVTTRQAAEAVFNTPTADGFADNIAELDLQPGQVKIVGELTTAVQKQAAQLRLWIKRFAPEMKIVLVPTNAALQSGFTYTHNDVAFISSAGYDDPIRNFGMLAHEFGHALINHIFGTANPAHVKPLDDAYQELKDKMMTATIAQYAVEWAGPGTAIEIETIAREKGLKLSDPALALAAQIDAVNNMPGYWFSRNEFLAEQTSRYIVGRKLDFKLDEESKSLFDRVVAALRNFFSLVGRKTLPDGKDTHKNFTIFMDNLQDIVRLGKEYRSEAEKVFEEKADELIRVDRMLIQKVDQVENITAAISTLVPDKEGFVSIQSVMTALNKAGVSQFERDIIAQVKHTLPLIGPKISRAKLVAAVEDKLLPIKTRRVRWMDGLVDLGLFGAERVAPFRLPTWQDEANGTVPMPERPEPVSIWFEVPGEDFSSFNTHYRSKHAFGHVRTWATKNNKVYIAEVQSDVLSEVNKRAREWAAMDRDPDVRTKRHEAAEIANELKNDVRWQAVQANFGRMAVRRVMDEAAMSGQRSVHFSHPDTLIKIEGWPRLDMLNNAQIVQIRDGMLLRGREKESIEFINSITNLRARIQSGENVKMEDRLMPDVRGIYRSHAKLYDWVKKTYGGVDAGGWLNIALESLKEPTTEYVNSVEEAELRKRVEAAGLKNAIQLMDDPVLFADYMDIRQHSNKSIQWLVDTFNHLNSWYNGDGFIGTNSSREAEEFSRLVDSVEDESQTLGVPNVQFSRARGPDTKAVGKMLDDASGTKDFSKSFLFFQSMLQSGLKLTQLAKILPHVSGLQKYKNLARAMYAKSSNMMLDADDTVSKWHDRSKARSDKISNFLIDEAFKGVHLTSIMQDTKGQWVHTPNDKFMEEMKKRGINDEDAAFIIKVKQGFLDRLGDMERVLSQNIEAAFSGDPVGKAVRLDQIRKDFQTMRYKAFLPSSRFGKYSLQIKATSDFQLPSGETAKAGQVIYFATFESQKNRDIEAERVRGMFPGHEVHSGYLSDKLAPHARLPINFVNELKKELVLTEEEEHILDGLAWDASREGAFKRYIEKGKKYIPGASRDILRVYADYMWHTANAVSKMEFSGQLKKAIAEVDQQGRESKDGTPYDKIVDTLRKNFNYIMSPQAELQALRSAISLWYLVASPKTALMNLSSLPMLTYPHLAAEYGDTKALGAILKATKDVGAFWKKGTGLTADERLIMQWGKEDGVTTQSFAAELASASTSTVLERTLPNFTSPFFAEAVSSVEQRAKRAMWKTVHWGMTPFQVTEGLLRQTTLLAAYRLAVANGLPRATPKERAAYTKAVDAVDYTQNNYASWDKAPAMRGKRGVFLIFFSFVQNASFFMYGGDKGWWRALFVMLGLAGLQGLPGVENFLDVLNWTWKKFSGEKVDFRLEIREFVKQFNINPDLAMHGVTHFGLGTGWEASTSVGMGRIIPGTEALFGEGRLPERFMRASAEVGGPAGNLAMSFLHFLADDNPNTLARFDKILPPAVRNIERMHRYYAEGGVFDGRGHQLMGELSTSQLIGVGLGFRPTELASKQELMRMQRDSEEFWSLKRSSLMRAFSQSRISGDIDAIVDARKAIDDHNNTVPFSELRITTKDLRDSYKRRKAAKMKAERDRPTSSRYERLYESIQRQAEAP